MTTALGVDTLTYHCRLDAGEVTVEDGYRRRGFQVHWCYPGEGVAPRAMLLSELATAGARG